MDCEKAAEEFLEIAARNIDAGFESSVIFPGEDVSSKLHSGYAGTIKLGNGLHGDDDTKGMYSSKTQPYNLITQSSLLCYSRGVYIVW